MNNIAPSTLADIPQLVALMNKAYRGEESKKGWTTEADLLAGDIRTDASILENLIKDKNGDILNYKNEDGKIMGCVHLKKDGGKLYLGMLSVLPEQQGNGIGKIFLKKAEEYAKEKNCQAIYMQVISARTELNEWYARHGYRPTGKRKPFDVDEKYGTPTQKLEFIYLEKKILD